MLILAGLYIVIYIVLLTGYRRILSDDSGTSVSAKISIIISAKDEELTIKECLESIGKLDYPAENYEIIIVDDNSTDDTYKRASEIAKSKNNFRVISADENAVSGKRDALLKGIGESTYPFIVVTDADCFPLPGLLKRYSALFEMGYEFVFGPSPFYQGDTLINHISCIENLKNQFLALSLAAIGLPYSAAARNMGFSKEAFFRIGGYRNTRDTLSGDDDLLLREAVRNKLKIKAFYDKKALVYSRTKKTLKGYLNQKARHTQSSFHYLLRYRIILAVWHLLNLLMLASLPLTLVNINFIWLFIIKAAADTIILLCTQDKSGYRFNIIEIIYLDIVYEIFIVINFFNAIFRKIEWK
jgi:cellulose synthase/poly-beta-1,6-N-acetylglucosamine synthase-like glycosyltransferase